MKTRLTVVALVVLVTTIVYVNRSAVSAAQAGARADSPMCTLTGYKAASGLNAAVTGDAVTLTWDAANNQEVRMRFTLSGGTPTIQELAVRRKGGSWGTIAANATPEFRVTAAKRRFERSQMNTLRNTGVKEITPEIHEQYFWNSFWDAPLLIPGEGTPTTGQVAGLPRKPEDVTRATATYQATSCDVKTDGARLIVTFPGVTLGVFAGQLQYTVYKGSNLIQQAVIAKTDRNEVAYKYDAGLKGLALGAGTRMVWRDTTNATQQHFFGSARNEREIPVTSANRLLIAQQGAAGSIAAFPPPHNFFWSREAAVNLGYNWYRKDSDSSFSFGIRQAERESDHAEPRYQANFALYNARPGTMQHMPVFFYISADAAEPTREAVLAFTHGDRYRPLPGYKVMGNHYHMDLGLRLVAAGTPDAEIEDLRALKAVGLNIVTTAERVGTGGAEGNETPEIVLKQRQFQLEGARRLSDKDFLVMPSHEYQPPPFGGHLDMHYSRGTYWLTGRTAGQPFEDNIAPYGMVYRIGTSADLMEMAKRENIAMSMPHPRTKNNANYPDVFYGKPDAMAAFKDPRFESMGYRWGMGIDRSEKRWSELRVLPLLDELLNKFADDPGPAKHLLAISEAHHHYLADDIYGFQPVQYIKLASVPTPDDAGAIIKALIDGDSFVSSGEILIPSFSVQGTGAARKIVADLEWTFPLDFVEVVWGDGTRTETQIISTTEMPAFGKHRFEIPLDATGKKWVRFAAWDTAGNGALAQPVKLTQGGRQ